MKRTSTENSSQKRKHSKTHNNKENSSLVASLPYSSKEAVYSGTILKILLRNFMCHSALEVNFNSRINFIVGRNGSGKSAILTGLVVGLGGKATATSRGKSMRDFIKMGTQIATVEITLSNSGLCPYKQDVYGDKIIISRTLNHAGSSAYKIKNSRGEIVSGKREDLDKIVTALNIQVDNPISILNQDAAKSFLIKADPVMKYLLFMKATRMEQVHILYQEIKEMEVHCKVLLDTRKKALDETKMEMDRLHKSLTQLMAVSSFREMLTKCENELYWAVAICEENKLNLLTTELQKEKDNISSILKGLEDCRQQEESEKEKLSKINVQIGTLNEESGKFNEERENYIMEQTRAKENYIVAFRKYQAMNKKLDHLHSDVSIIKLELEKASQRTHTEFGLRKQRLQENMVTVDTDLEQLHAILKTTDHHCDQLQGAIDHYKSTRTSLSEELNDISQNSRKIKTRIQDLKGETDSSLTVYGSWMPHLVQKIEEAFRKQRFRVKPIGPIGAYIKVKDPKWAPAVESIFSRNFLQTFCVNDVADSNVMLKVMDEALGSLRKPGLIISKFLSKVHDVTPNLVCYDGGSDLFNMLDISNPVIANCLIDRYEVEGILLVPTGAIARDLTCEAYNVPRKCNRVLTLNGDQYYPDPDYRSYGGKGFTKTKFIQVRKDEAIRVLEEELQTLNNKSKDVQQQSKNAQEQVERNSRELTSEQFKREELAERKRRLTVHKNKLKDELDTEPPNLKSLTEELDSAIKRTEEAAKEEESLNKASCEMKQILETADRKLLDMNETIKKMRSNMPKLQRERSVLIESQRAVTSKIKLLEDKQENLSAKVKHIECSLNEQNKKTEKTIADAGKLCPRINTKRYPVDIKQELDDLKLQIRTIESQNGSVEEVGAKYVETKTRFNRISRSMKKLQTCLEILKSSVSKRRQLYYRVLKLMGLRVSYMFQPLLKQRNYVGSLDFNHKNKTLTIEASPANGNKNFNSGANCLSGGERSFSTIAFVLALWEAVDLPFYFMDEFDVFMDKVNRAITLELLMTHAQKKSHYQYVFLTPQDTSAVHSSSDITIHKLMDPDKS